MHAVLRRERRVGLPEIVTVITAAVTCWFACAPRMTLLPPPVSADPESALEGGLGVSVGQSEKLTYTQDGDRRTATSYWPQTQLYGQVRLGRSPVYLGANVFTIGAGPYLRYVPIEKQRLYVATHLSAGLLYLQLGVPVGWSPSDGWWITTAPSLQGAPWGAAFEETLYGAVPLGVSRELGERAVLSLEGGIDVTGDVYTNELHARPYAGLGITFREANAP